MVAFLTDTYTEASNTALSSHTSDSGHTLALAYAYDGTIDASTGRVRGNATGQSIYATYSVVPPQADYYAEAVLYPATVSGYCGVQVRASADNFNAYEAYYDTSNGRWTLSRRTNNVGSTLGTYVQTLTAGTPYTLRLEASGTTIRLVVDGVVRVSVSNVGLSTVGKIGLLFIDSTATSSTAGIHITSLTADTLAPLPGEGTTIGTLVTTALRNSLSFRLPFTGDVEKNNSTTVRFKKASDSTWQSWPPMWRVDDGTVREFRDGIFDLDGGTSYNVEITVVDADGVTGTNPVAVTVSTRTDAIATPATVRAGTINYFVNADTGNDTNAGTTSGAAFKNLLKAIVTVNAVTGTTPIVVQVAASATRSYTLNWFGVTRPNVTFIASNEAVNDARAPTAGAHANIEYGYASGDNVDSTHVSGPSGSSATYPQVTETPWVSDGTITDGTGVVRTVYRWDSFPFSPYSIGYASTRFGAPALVASWKNSGYTVAAWKNLVANNGYFHSGWLYSGGTLYLILPDASASPNTQYLTVGTGAGFNLWNTNTRICGFVFRGFTYGCHTESGSSDAIIDHNDFQNCYVSVQFKGDKNATPDVYGTGHLVERNRTLTTNLWSVAQASTGTRDLAAIAWEFIKADTSDGVTSIQRAGEYNESAGIWSNGGAHGVTIRYNTIDGPFNGIGAYNSGFDSLSIYAQEIHDNLFTHIADDCLEPEQNGSCWFLWKNTYEWAAVGLSTGPVNYGPLSLCRETFWQICGDGVGRSDGGSCGVGPCLWKYSGGSAPMALVRWYHVSAWTDKLYTGPFSGGPTGGVDGFAKNAGGGPPAFQEGAHVYNSLFRFTRYSSSAPAHLWVENGNHWATSNSTRGLAHNGTNYTTSVSGYRAASGQGANTNTAGDFVTVSVIDNALTSPTTGTLSLNGAAFKNVGSLIPTFSVAYPGSGPEKVWHYRGTAPDRGALESVPSGADVTAPVFASASVPANGATVAVVLNDDSPPILPATGVTGFAVTVAGVSRSITSAAVSGTTVTLTLASVVNNGQVVTVAYTPGNVTDSATTPNALGTFGAQSVTNNSTQGQGVADTTRPVFASASIPAIGTTVAVVLTEAGSPPILPASGVTGFTVTVAGVSRSVTSATASGTTATLTLASVVYSGQAVTVAYAPGNVTDSATTPNAMLAFGAQSVANGSTQTVAASGRGNASGRVAESGRAVASGRVAATGRGAV